MDARTGEARRRPEELADAPQARRDRGRASRARAAAGTSRCSATLGRGACRPGDDWLYEVKWDGYRALAYVRGGDARVREPQRQRSDGAVPVRASARSSAAVRDARTACSTARSARSTSDGRASFSAMQQGKPETPLVYVVFDVLEVEGEPLVDLPLVERRERLEQLLDRREDRRPDLGDVRRRRGASTRPPPKQGLEGVVAKRADSRYQPGRRTREWLKIKTHGTPGVRDRRLHEGPGPPRRPLRLARARRTRAASCATSATSAPGSATTRSTGCSRCSGRSSARSRRSRSVPKMPKVRKGDVVWVEPQLVGRGRVRRVDARRPPARARLPGAARGQGAGGGAPRGAARRTSSARASAS